jgi:hypothetical protein
MPPPRDTYLGRFRDAERLGARVCGEQVPKLSAAMRTHGIGAYVAEDADEERNRVHRQCLLSLAVAGLEPSHPGFLGGVVDDFARQARCRGSGDARKLVRDRAQPRLVGAHARPRMHTATNFWWPPVRCRIRLAAHKSRRAHTTASATAACAAMRRRRIDPAPTRWPCAAQSRTPSFSSIAGGIVLSSRLWPQGLCVACLGNQTPASPYRGQRTITRLHAQAIGADVKNAPLYDGL